MGAINLCEGANPKPAKRAQNHQRGEALPFGEHSTTSVVVVVAPRSAARSPRSARRNPRCRASAEATQDTDHPVGGLALRRRLAPVLRDPANPGTAERRLRTNVANIRHLAAGKELGRRVAVDLDPRPEAAPTSATRGVT